MAKKNIKDINELEKLFKKDEKNDDPLGGHKLEEFLLDPIKVDDDEFSSLLPSNSCSNCSKGYKIEIKSNKGIQSYNTAGHQKCFRDDDSYDIDFKFSYKKPFKDISKFNNPMEYEHLISDDLLKEFEELVKSKGFEGVSYVEYEEKGSLKGLMIFRGKMDEEALKLEISDTKHDIIDEDFQKMAINVFIFSDFLRSHGFATEIINPLDKYFNFKYYAEKSNDAVLGRSGVCIFPEGPNMGLFGILTSIENLPIKKNNELLWIKDVCKNCGKCIKNCPVNAFDENEHVIRTKCIGFKKGCNICLTNCTFFFVDFEVLRKAFDKF